MTLRTYEPKDFQSIQELNKEGLSYPPPDQWMLDRILNGYTVVAVDLNDNVIGVLTGNVRYNINESKAIPNIVNIVVSKQNRNNGIATSLIRDFENHYQTLSYTCADLYVEASNNVAKSLYEKLDYSVCDTLRDFYGVGKDALVMSKSLQSGSDR